MVFALCKFTAMAGWSNDASGTHTYARTCSHRCVLLFSEWQTVVDMKNRHKNRMNNDFPGVSIDFRVDSEHPLGIVPKFKFTACIFVVPMESASSMVRMRQREREEMTIENRESL